MTNEIVEKAFAAGAQALHLVGGRNGKSFVHFVTDHGLLTRALTYPRRLHMSFVSRFKIMANLSIAEKKVQVGSIRRSANHKAFATGAPALQDLTAVCFPGVEGENLLITLRP